MYFNIVMVLMHRAFGAGCSTDRTAELVFWAYPKVVGA